jgi:hypothetical protein
MDDPRATISHGAPVCPRNDLSFVHSRMQVSILVLAHEALHDARLQRRSWRTLPGTRTTTLHAICISNIDVHRIRRVTVCCVDFALLWTFQLDLREIAVFLVLIAYPCKVILERAISLRGIIGRLMFSRPKAILYGLEGIYP